MATSGASGGASASGMGAGLGGAIIGGVVGGAIGAAIWAAIAYFANLESGWVAWGIGALTGLGVFLGGGKNGGAVSGVVAVVIALASICAGKYAAIHFSLADAEAEFAKQVEADLAATHNDDDSFLLAVADSIADEWTAEGKTINWPNSKAMEDREEVSDYPPELIKEATSRWAALSPEEKESLKHDIEENVRAGVREQIAAMHSQIASEGFVESWGLFDILFVGLAIASAFRLGSAGNQD